VKYVLPVDQDNLLVP